jgi:hypothetical protein
MPSSPIVVPEFAPDTDLPSTGRQDIAVLIGYHDSEAGVTVLAVCCDWSTFDV